MEATAEPTRDLEAPASVWEDFIDIFFDPAPVFARHRDGRFAFALVFLTIVMAVLFYGMQQVLAPAFDAEFNRAMASSGQDAQITSEQMQQMREMSGVFGLVGFVVAFPISVLLMGLIVWTLGRIFGATASIAAAMAIVTFSMFPRIIQSLVSIVQGLILDPSSLNSLHAVSIGPARFVDPVTTSPVLLAILGRFDLFIIWSVVLVAIGVHVAGNLPKSRAWIVAGLLWVVGALPMLIGALTAGAS